MKSLRKEIEGGSILYRFYRTTNRLFRVPEQNTDGMPGIISYDLMRIHRIPMTLKRWNAVSKRLLDLGWKVAG